MARVGRTLLSVAFDFSFGFALALSLIMMGRCHAGCPELVIPTEAGAPATAKWRNPPFCRTSR